MEQIKKTELTNYNGGNSYIDGACLAVGVSDGAFGAGRYFAKRIGSMALSTALKGITGGPVGWLLVGATIGCIGYTVYKNI